MPFVQAKCPECGGVLAVDADRKAAVCQFCGEAFIVQDAINNYNTYNETINNYNTTHQYGDGTVVNVYEDKNKDFIIEAGVLREYHGESVNVVIPDNVKEIASRAFENKKIETVTGLKNTVKIGEYAFNNCADLTYIELPLGLLTIGACAFQNCKNLNELCIPESVKEIAYGVFSDCGKIKLTYGGSNLSWIEMDFYPYQNAQIDFTYKKGVYGIFEVPYGISKLGVGCFSGLQDLTKLKIPDTVQNIGNFAFYNCSGLIDVNIPSSVKTIGISAFDGCVNLNKVDMAFGVTEIETCAFCDCKSLGRVDIPDSVEGLSRSVFRNCENLQDVVLSKKLFFIGSEAFADCLNLHSLDIPLGTHLMPDTFKDSCLKTVNFFGCGNFRIEKNAFNECKNRVQVNFNSILLDDECSESIRVLYNEYVSVNIENVEINSKIGRNTVTFLREHGDDIKNITIDGKNMSDEDIYALKFSLCCYSFYGTEKPINSEKIRYKSLSRSASFMVNQKCRYCGGEFKKKIFSEQYVCKDCGKRKDY